MFKPSLLLSTIYLSIIGTFFVSCESSKTTQSSNTLSLRTGEWALNLKHPESVAFDGTYFYVSDFGDLLAPHLKDGKGRIAKIDTSGRVISANISKFVLSKPKGLILIGNNTILVTDVDSLKAINMTTGELSYAIGFLDLGVNFGVAGNPGLNDLEKGASDSIVYVSLTNNSKVYKVNLSTKTKTEIATVPGANGLAYDTKNNALYAVGYTTQPSLTKVDLSNNTARLLEGGYVGKVGLDGIAIVGDNLYISDWGEGATGSNEVGVLVKYNLTSKTTDNISLSPSIGKANINGPADFIVVGQYIVIPALGGGNIYVTNL